jgi:hypothetical protein
VGRVKVTRPGVCVCVVERQARPRREQRPANVRGECEREPPKWAFVDGACHKYRRMLSIDGPASNHTCHNKVIVLPNVVMCPKANLQKQFVATNTTMSSCACHSPSHAILIAAEDRLYSCLRTVGYIHCCRRQVEFIAADDRLYPLLQKASYTHCCRRWVILIAAESRL